MTITILACSQCQHRFCEQDAATIHETISVEFWGADTPLHASFSVCPRCGSYDLEEISYCMSCANAGMDANDLPEPMAGADQCRPCFDAEAPTPPRK